MAFHCLPVYGGGHFCFNTLPHFDEFYDIVRLAHVTTVDHTVNPDWTSWAKDNSINFRDARGRILMRDKKEQHPSLVSVVGVLVENNDDLALFNLRWRQ